VRRGGTRQAALYLDQGRIGRGMENASVFHLEPRPSNTPEGATRSASWIQFSASAASALAKSAELIGNVEALSLGSVQRPVPATLFGRVLWMLWQILS